MTTVRVVGPQERQNDGVGHADTSLATVSVRERGMRRSLTIYALPVHAVHIRPMGPGDVEFVRGQLLRTFHSFVIWSRDVEFRADALPGFIGEVDGVPRGHLTLHLGSGETEVITLVSEHEDVGLGAALLERAVEVARERACSRVFLTTTNDNLRALGFYQRRGWRIVALHRGVMDLYRERAPAMPTHAANGIPIHDELELELRF
jgi:GNAT superfamily N-acetyltransferase